MVRARDYTHDPGHGVDINRLSDELAATCDPRIKYVIANNLIMNGSGGTRPWQWRTYTGTNPHRAHLHLSVVAGDRADDTRPWALPMLTPDQPEENMPSAQEIAAAVADVSIKNFKGQMVAARWVWAGGEGYAAGTRTELAELREMMTRLAAQQEALARAVTEALASLKSNRLP